MFYQRIDCFVSYLEMNSYDITLPNTNLSFMKQYFKFPFTNHSYSYYYPLTQKEQQLQNLKDSLLNVGFITLFCPLHSKFVPGHLAF